MTAPLQVGSAPFYETQAGHRCNTWRSQGKAGMECAHGHVILPHDVATAKLRAERVQRRDGHRCIGCGFPELEIAIVDMLGLCPRGEWGMCGLNLSLRL